MRKIPLDKKRLLKDIGEAKSEHYLIVAGDLLSKYKPEEIIAAVVDTLGIKYYTPNYSSWDYKFYPYLGYEINNDTFCGWGNPYPYHEIHIDLSKYLVDTKAIRPVYDFNEQLL